MATASAEPKAALVPCKDQKKRKLAKESGEKRVNHWQALLLSRFAGSAGSRGERSTETKEKRRAPPPFTSQRRLGVNSQDKLSDISKVSVKVLQEWEKSFESLMASSEGIALFEDFLRSEFSEENILFWKACERYSKLSLEELQDEAEKIYQEFLCDHSPKLVNLDHQTMTSVLASIKDANPNTFKKAQNSIFTLMASDSYKRFISSDKFQSALKWGAST